VLLRAARIGQTEHGFGLIQAAPEEASDEAYIGVFRTPIDYGRGGFVWANRHTGDFLEWRCKDCGVRTTEGEGPEELYTCLQCGGVVRPVFKEWPGDDLVVGQIGAADQRISVIPAGVVVREGTAGQHGGAWSHYYLYRDGRLLAATWQERLITDIF